MAKEHKGHWQAIKYNTKGDPFVTYQGRKMPVSLFMNNGAGEFVACEGYTCYILEVNEYGDRARVTYCPPSY